MVAATTNGSHRAGISWVELGTTAGIIIALMGALGWGPLQILDRHDAALDAMRAANLVLERTVAEHGVLIDGLRSAFTKMDADLQREMRDLDAGMAAAVEGADSRLQAEITNAVNLLRDLASTNRDRIAAIDEFLATKYAESVAARTSADERLKALERLSSSQRSPTTLAP